MSSMIVAIILITVLMIAMQLTGEGFKSDNKGVVIMLKPQDYVEMIKTQKAVLIDVRTVDEFEMGHIENAINIPLNMLEHEIETQADYEDNVVIYCLSGARASTACAIAEQLGYKNIYNLGGINRWPYDIVK